MDRERAHAEVVGQREGLAIGVCGFSEIWGIAVGCGLAQEAERPRLEAALAALAGEREEAPGERRNTSMRRRMPPSRVTRTRPVNASMTSRSTVMLAGSPSRCRPPWLESWMAAAPAAIAASAPCGRKSPLTMTGNPAASRTNPMSSKLTATFLSSRFPVPPYRGSYLP